MSISHEKIKKFIETRASLINLSPEKFLKHLDTNSTKLGLSLAEEDYLAYTVLYLLGLKHNYTYSFNISTDEDTPIGFYVECLENPDICWYSSCDGDESIDWLKDLGWLQDYLDLPTKIVSYFKQFPVE